MGERIERETKEDRLRRHDAPYDLETLLAAMNDAAAAAHRSTCTREGPGEAVLRNTLSAAEVAVAHSWYKHRSQSGMQAKTFAKGGYSWSH